jgi:multicomponent Na+:H+ antiporter subunit A
MPALMLAASILAGFGAAGAAPAFVRRFGPRAAAWIALVPAALALYYGSLAYSGPAGPPVLPWAPSLGLNLSFTADGLGLLFALIVSGVGAVVAVYSSGYFGGDARLGRFYGWLLVFMAAMLGVVLSDNLLLLYVFWEITSVSSYILIGFDHEETESRAAALEALVVTVAGGLCLLGGVVLLGLAGGSFEISTLIARREGIQADPVFVPALVLVLVGAFTKSAQFPFHFWLPSAMAAPAPVSAYLHSAAMVKAGIYLLLRLHPLLGGNAVWTWVAGGAGLVTLLLGAFMALGQTDLKRLLAYSTVSALGMMTLLIGMGTPASLGAAVVFVTAHALYKGALFLSAGSVDHGAGTRDVRVLGGLFAPMPRTALGAGAAALSMAGVLPLLGAIGKEMAYEAGLEHGPGVAAAVVAGGLGFFFVAAVAGYGPFRGGTPAAAHEVPRRMWAGVWTLAGCGLLLGLWPGAAAGLLGSAAAAAGAPGMELKLWHGFGPAFGLSLATLAAGAGLYALRARVRESAGRLTWRRGPEAAYEALLGATLAGAAGITRGLQSGRLRNYLVIIVLTLVGLAATPLLLFQGIHWPDIDYDLRFGEIGIAAVILLSAGLAVRSRSLLGAVAAMGAAGYAVATIYLRYGAPDLAMTQFLIESLTVLLFVLAVYRLPNFARLSSRRARGRDAVVALLGGGLVTALVLVATGMQLHHPISDYYVQTAVGEAHGRNIVNVILVDFRGLDTLGEATVLGIAAIGVLALIKLKRKGP